MLLFTLFFCGQPYFPHRLKLILALFNKSIQLFLLFAMVMSQGINNILFVLIENRVIFSGIGKKK